MRILQYTFYGFIFSIAAVFIFAGLTSDSHAQSCVVEVIKNAEPADNTEFNFSYTTAGFTEEFQLSDPGDNSLNIPLGEEATITEVLPPGWALASIECEANAGIINFSVSGSTVTVTCSPQGIEQGTCVFNNVIATRNVPTLSEWGLIAMASILGIVGFIVARKRKVTA